MAEVLGKKTEDLITFCLAIKNKENNRENYEMALSEIKSITPSELILVMNEQLNRGVSVPEMLLYVDKLINVFREPLMAYPWPKPQPDTFLHTLMLENAAMIARLQAFKTVIKQKDTAKTKAKLPALIAELMQYHIHMQKLENLLFPALEQIESRFIGLKTLWALHDRARGQLKQTYALLEAPDTDEKSFNVALGRLYFLLYGLVEKQELILFPAATDVITDEEMAELHAQSFEYGFALIEAPKRPKSVPKAAKGKTMMGQLMTETGSLSLTEIEAMMNILPIDMTLIGANDKVKFFSKPKERIFPRSPAIIGRDVRNCHPPKSVHIVERILNAFKTGKKDSARFWIQMDEKFVVIDYYALRDKDGEYLGTLEVSQEASAIRALSGQQRLLDWQEDQ